MGLGRRRVRIASPSSAIDSSARTDDFIERRFCALRHHVHTHAYTYVCVHPHIYIYIYLYKRAAASFHVNFLKRRENPHVTRRLAVMSQVCAIVAAILKNGTFSLKKSSTSPPVHNLYPTRIGKRV